MLKTALEVQQGQKSVIRPRAFRMGHVHLDHVVQRNEVSESIRALFCRVFLGCTSLKG